MHYIGMKSNAVPVILVLACLGLGVVLLLDSKHHQDEKRKQDSTIVQYSNHVTTLEGQLREQTNVNYILGTNLTETQLEVAKASNDLVALQANLSTTQENLEKSQADAKAAAEKAAADLAERDKKIGTLESQNQELDKESIDLRASITNKEAEIQDAKKKLADSEGDKAFLVKEVKRLQAEKADLEKKFSDLEALREQVRKLKDDLSLARKLDWIRRGIYDSIKVKGGELLTHPEPSAPPLTNGTMNVEIRQNGGVKVGAPGPTNAPPGK